MTESIATAILTAAALAGIATPLVARRAPHPDTRAAVAALVATGAFVLALLLTEGFPTLPPAIATDYAPWAVVAGGLAGSVLAYYAPEGRIVFVVALALSVTTAWVILGQVEPGTWSVMERKQIRFVWWCSILVLTALPELVERRRRRPLPRLPVLVALLAASLTMGWSSSGHLARLGAVLFGAAAGAWAGLAILALGRPAQSLAFVPTLGLGALLLAAHTFADLATGHALLLGASASCSVIDHREKRWVGYLGTALALALAGIAAWQAHAAAPPRWPGG